MERRGDLGSFRKLECYLWEKGSQTINLVGSTNYVVGKKLQGALGSFRELLGSFRELDGIRALVQQGKEGFRTLIQLGRRFRELRGALGSFGELRGTSGSFRQLQGASGSFMELEPYFNGKRELEQQSNRKKGSQSTNLVGKALQRASGALGSRKHCKLPGDLKLGS